MLPNHETVNEETAPKRPRRETAWYSLLGAGIVAISVLGLWWLVRSAAPAEMAAQRRLSDTNVVWECPSGHTFEGRGGNVRLACPQCERGSDIQTAYVCPNHGELKALIRVERMPDGGERLDRVSFRTGVWTQVKSAVVCPDCGTLLGPKVDRPFARSRDD